MGIFRASFDGYSIRAKRPLSQLQHAEYAPSSAAARRLGRRVCRLRRGWALSKRVRLLWYQAMTLLIQSCSSLVFRLCYWLPLRAARSVQLIGRVAHALLNIDQRHVPQTRVFSALVHALCRNSEALRVLEGSGIYQNWSVQDAAELRFAATGEGFPQHLIWVQRMYAFPKLEAPRFAAVRSLRINYDWLQQVPIWSGVKAGFENDFCKRAWERKSGIQTEVWI